MTYKEFKRIDFDKLEGERKIFIFICKDYKKEIFIVPILWDEDCFNVLATDWCYSKEEIYSFLEKDFDYETGEDVKIEILKVITDKAIIEEYLDN